MRERSASKNVSHTTPVGGLKARVGKLASAAQNYAVTIWQTRAFWTRALLCWLVGAFLLHNDEANNYDLRLKIRGPRAGSSEILLVDVAERDWMDLDQATRNVLRPLKEVVSFTDAFFWNQRNWQSLLTRVLGDRPKAVGVTFFFGDNVRSQKILTPPSAVFFDPRIVWATEVDTASHVLSPLFAKTYENNIGLRTFRADDDGTVRRFSPGTLPIPALAMQVARRARPDLEAWMEKTYTGNVLINFVGGVLDSSFRIVNARDVIEGRISPALFRDKVVLIGSLGSLSEQLQTPVGRMSRTEVTANLLDNMIAQKTVLRFDRGFYLLLLIFVLFGSIWILATYPQSVALVTFIFAAIIWAAFSVWAFDIADIWIPVLSPFIELATTCIVFLSYQLALNESRTWRLEQERRYLEEIEKLKTNFVSMMSHDLKTPIAKIQAICDRLLASVADSEISTDLRSLRKSSDELHRYIQSILQVTKVEAKDFKIHKEVTDINEDIEKVVQRIKPLADERKIRISIHLEPMFSIEADTTLIQEVIHNLIENAIKYTPTGGQVIVTSQEKDDLVTVVVEDTGPGIDLEDQRDIWGKFTRGRNQSMDIKGTGLGLYLVKYFVELHGGKVFLESEKGQGTRIGFSIPVAADLPDDEAEQVSDVIALRSEDETARNENERKGQNR